MNYVLIINYYFLNKYYKIVYLSSKGIEPLVVINQFFYRESPLPIGHLPPILNRQFLLIFFFLFLSLINISFKFYCKL